MKHLKEIIKKSKDNMTYRDIDFFEMLDQKEKKSVFYPSLIMNFAEYKNYPADEAGELALLSQLLYYSIELHEKTRKNDDSETLLILGGDYLFSLVFRMITGSKHIKDIRSFTEFIKKFSEKRVLCIDGALDNQEILTYKCSHLAKIAVAIISDNDQLLLDLGEELASLYAVYLEDEKTYELRKNEFLSVQQQNISSELYAALEKIADSIGGAEHE